MSPDRALARRIRRRLQPVAESLLENSALRDTLSDQQAQRLLNWGLAYLQHEAERTAHLPDQDAHEFLDGRATVVVDIARKIPELVRALPTADETAAEARLRELVMNANRLNALPLSLAQLVQLQMLVEQRRQLDEQGRFAALMDLITNDTEEE